MNCPQFPMQSRSASYTSAFKVYEDAQRHTRRSQTTPQLFHSRVGPFFKMATCKRAKAPGFSKVGTRDEMGRFWPLFVGPGYYPCLNGAFFQILCFESCNLVYNESRLVVVVNLYFTRVILSEYLKVYLLSTGVLLITDIEEVVTKFSDKSSMVGDENGEASSPQECSR